MDFLQAALIFLILLLSIFLAITGFQVFFILRDLKKALDRLNIQNIEKPLPTALKPKTNPRPKRFYKKVL